jgi:ribosome recycling factor
MNEKEILDRADARMAGSLDDTRAKLATVRTGRASLSLLDRIKVDYYGTPTPLNQMAKLSVPEPTLIIAQPFDPSITPDIERAIMASDLGVNPSSDGKLITIPIPPLTEDRRKQMVKKVRALGEESKTSIRQIRREANDEFKALEKAGEFSEDDLHRCLALVQKLTDGSTAAIDDLCNEKEKELLEI